MEFPLRSSQANPPKGGSSHQHLSLPAGFAPANCVVFINPFIPLSLRLICHSKMVRPYLLPGFWISWASAIKKKKKIGNIGLPAFNCTRNKY